MPATQTTNKPHISLIMPCYNEEEAVGYTIPRLLSAFKSGGYRLELVAVDNGSTDSTGTVLEEMARANPAIVVHHIMPNEGYGNGILQGIPHCTAPWIGFIPADGQVDAEDVVRLYEAVVTTNGRVLGKVRRRFRMDGFMRKVVSVGYNLFVRLLWPRLQSLDLNGTPKLLPRDALMAMDLKFKGWLLDPEVMIKSHYMGLRVLELNAFARMRGNGVSHVRAATVWEFIWNLLIFRFSQKWQRDFQLASQQYEQARRSPAAMQPAVDLGHKG